MSRRKREKEREGKGEKLRSGNENGTETSTRTVASALCEMTILPFMTTIMRKIEILFKLIQKQNEEISNWRTY